MITDDPNQQHPAMIDDEPHHQHLDLLLEFLGVIEPGAHKQAIAACRPVNGQQRRRAELVAHSAWEQLLRADVELEHRSEWRRRFPASFLHLTDDYELMVLFLWTWIDLKTAKVFRITMADPAIPLFNEGWLRVHLPGQRHAALSPVQEKWLCPQLCNTCRTARVSCPTCRTVIRFWPPSRAGRDRGHTIIKEVPPCGAGPVWSPAARQGIEDHWAQLVVDAIDEQTAHRNSIHRPPWPGH
jgi:hypothetical protein